MKEINFIITVYDKEAYWPYLKNVIDSYKKIKSNYILCYSGEDNNFQCDIKRKNVINGGRGNNHHEHSCPYVDMDYNLILDGYNLLKENGVKDWIKLSVDSWLLDENKILQIFNFLENNQCVYGGNYWYTHINLSTDIFFVNTRDHNIFNDLYTYGPKFLDWLYYNKIPTGLENLMRYIVIPYNHAIIMDREPMSADGTRWLCSKLGWCMSHDLGTNIEFLKKYQSDDIPVNMIKINSNNIPYDFDLYLKDSGQYNGTYYVS
jgi:hypothetical protein